MLACAHVMRARSAIILVACLVGATRAQYYEGDACTTSSGAAGACAAFSRCPTASEILMNGGVPKTCSFSGREPIICCPAGGAPRPQPPTTSPPRRQTTEYVPTEADYEYDTSSAQCPAIAADRTGVKTGRRAWDKCIEYQELVYPCVSSAGLSLSDEKVRADYCGHSAAELVVGGVDTKEKEFPHAVMLGYGAGGDDSWLCGGTIVSEWFVVTAGHCTFSREFGQVTTVRTAALRRSAPVDKKRTYAVRDIIKHPGYKAPSKYNDIALLRTQTQMLLDQYTVPACLDTGAVSAGEKALAVGWGATQYKGANADVLQKVVLEKFTTSECRTKFPPGERNMREGFQQDSQLCYGDHEQSRDTCQGDSGGPLQTYNTRVHCMYWLIGVTSFGKACGFAGSPGIYTRVAHYTPWIESIVWP